MKEIGKPKCNEFSF